MSCADAIFTACFRMCWKIPLKTCFNFSILSDAAFPYPECGVLARASAHRPMFFYNPLFFSGSRLRPSSLTSPLRCRFHKVFCCLQSPNLFFGFCDPERFFRFLRAKGFLNELVKESSFRNKQISFSPLHLRQNRRFYEKQRSASRNDQY